MALVDLKMSKQDVAEETSPVSPENQNPYPYGLCIRLDTDELAKLGITEANLPGVGDEFHIAAVGCTTSVSENETADGGYQCGVSIQIQMMDLKNEGQDTGQESTSEEETEGVRGTTILQSTYRGKPGDES